MTLNARRARTEEGSGAVVAGERAEGWCGWCGWCVRVCICVVI
jgi:ferredoxin